MQRKTFHEEREREKGRKRNVVVIFLSDRRERKRCSFEVIKVENFPDPLQQQRPDLPRLLQQVHAQQLPPGAAMGPHPGIPGLPGLGPGAGLPVPTSASAALLGLGIPPGAAATAGGTAAHPLSMLTKPDIHRQADDLKHNGGKRLVHFFSEIVYRRGLIKSISKWRYIKDSKRKNLKKRRRGGKSKKKLLSKFSKLNK